MYNDPYGNPYPGGGQGQQPPQNPYEQPPNQNNVPPFTQYNAQPPLPNYAVPPQQPKQSLRWLWITLIVLGVILVLGCGVCGFIVYGIGKSANQTITQAEKAIAPSLVVNEYYQSIEGQRYATAYSYLDPAIQTLDGTPITADTFTTAAQSVDTKDGLVSNFTVSISPGIDNTGNQATYTVKVTRNGTSYTSTIGLKLESGSWKIVSYDRI